MPEYIRLLIWIIWPPVAFWLLLGLFPSAITKFVEKEIERRSDAKLERVKAELQGAYSTLKTSVDVLLATNSGIQPHIIGAVEALWSSIVEMRHYSSGAVTFETMLLPAEAEKAFADQADIQNKKILAFVAPYRNEATTASSPAFKADLDQHRVFCGDRLWAIFFAMRAILGRLTLLMSLSFSKGLYQDWRKDEPMGRLMRVASAKRLYRRSAQ